MRHQRSPITRKVLASLALLAAAISFAVVLGLLHVNTRPVQLTDSYGAATVSYTAGQKWVLFPEECVEVAWTTQNVASTTFYPVIQPGQPYGDGVRQVFMTRDTRVGISVTEDARGGQFEAITSTDPQTRSASACIDFTSEPKLRVHFLDGSSKSYTLGLDSFFLRLEVWLLLISATTFFSLAAILIPSKRFTLTHVLTWISTALLSFYAMAFYRQGDFFAHYLLDAIIFLIVWGSSLILTVLSLFSHDRFHTVLDYLLSRSYLSFGVILFWLWILAFGYADPAPSARNELFWLPLFLWAWGLGLIVLGYGQSSNKQSTVNKHHKTYTTVKSCLQLALCFAAISLIRDLILIQLYSITQAADTRSYIITAKNFLEAGSSIGLPKRIFPYLLMNFITNSNYTPVPLVMLQSIIAALSVGMMTYVTARKHWWLGLITGILLSLNLSWGMYNRIIMTESGFISFNVLSFAVIFWHIQRKHSISYWELFLCGILYGWTLLFRGTGLPLIVPILAIYYFFTRTWFKPLVVMMGFSCFLLTVGLYNQWRYAEFGIIGPQSDTLASALFSYHLFSPENGSTSKEIHEQLSGCMGYLDYHDVPRSINYFIYGHYNPCMEQRWEVDEITQMTSRALRELIVHNPWDFGRVLIEELGIGLKQEAGREFQTKNNQLIQQNDNTQVCHRQIAWCKDFRQIEYTENPFLLNLNRLLTIPNQVYLVVQGISSNTSAVMLFAFLMLIGFLWIKNPEKFIVGSLSVFIIYQLTTVSTVHNFIPRYGIILGPFSSIISAITLWHLGQRIRKLFEKGIQLKRVHIGLIVLCTIYGIWANPYLRLSMVMPLSARIQVNLIAKYGVINAIDFQTYIVLKQHGGIAFSPSFLKEDANQLSITGLITNVFGLTPYQLYRLRGWEATRLPSYIRDMGFTSLLLDERQWANLSEDAKAVLSNPAHYQLLGAWEADGDSRRLYALVGTERASYTIYEGTAFVVFEQSDLALDVYRLDENRNGMFIARIPPQTVLSTAVYESEIGWKIHFEPQDPRTYRMVITNEDGMVIDEPFTIVLP